MKEQGKGKALIKLLLILIATIGFCFGGYKYIGDVKLGLDLAGGVSITYEANEENPSQEDMDDTIYKLQRRAEGYSSESAVYQEGSNRINIDIPGVSDANAILEELGKPGSLQFITFTYDEEGNITGEGDVVVEGSDIDTAGVGQRQGQAGEADSYVVQVRFTDEGAKKFADATAANIGKIIGIVYDGELISYPRVDEAITGGECQITGDFTYEEADNLAQTIRLGALKLELTEVRSNVVGARLGQQAVSTSLFAGAIGFAINMDLINGCAEDQEEYDVDVLLLYGKAAESADFDPEDLADRVNALIEEGYSVQAQKNPPERLKYRKLVEYLPGGVLK